MKSLAHPGWPYLGTKHEWRGFDPASIELRQWGKDYLPDMARSLTEDEERVFAEQQAVYQKQNFGPELT